MWKKCVLLALYPSNKQKTYKYGWMLQVKHALPNRNSSILLMSVKSSNMLIGGVHEVINTTTIVRTFKIWRASHVTENSKQPSAKIIIFSDLKLLVYVLDSSQNKYWRFQVQDSASLGTVPFSIIGHVTCRANVKLVYSVAYWAPALNIAEIEWRLKRCWWMFGRRYKYPIWIFVTSHVL